MRDVHARKRMFLAAKISKCGNFIGHKPVCTRMKRIVGHVIPSSTCKIAVSQTKVSKVAVESARTLMRLRAGTVKRLLKESASGAPSSFNRHAHGSIYMLRTLIKVPTWFASAGSLQLSVWGAVLEA